MLRTVLFTLIALASLPEAQALSDGPGACESEVYGWTSKDLSQATRQELARSFCSEANAAPGEIAPCLEDAHDWFAEVAHPGKRVELAFLTCSNVAQASEKTDYFLFDMDTATRASSCLQRAWDANDGHATDARYRMAAETCLEVLAVAPEEEHAVQTPEEPSERMPEGPGAGADLPIGDDGEDVIGPH